MHEKFTPMTRELYAWVLEMAAPRDPIVDEVVAATQDLGEAARMQIALDQGPLLTLLARMVGAGTALEIGTFTGLSTLSIARGLSGNGRLYTCDLSAEWMDVARKTIEKAGMSDRVRFLLGPALRSLADLPDSLRFDLVFVDADKEAYPDYFDWAVPRLREGGLLVVDNAFWGGAVADPSRTDPGVEGIRELTRRARDDDRLDMVLLPVSDGLLLARRR